VAPARERPAGWQCDLDSVCQHEDVQAGLVAAHVVARRLVSVRPGRRDILAFYPKWVITEASYRLALPNVVGEFISL
jgi:hypothetical protein